MSLFPTYKAIAVSTVSVDLLEDTSRYWVEPLEEVVLCTESHGRASEIIGCSDEYKMEGMEKGRIEE